MKNLFAILLLSFVLFGNQVVRADGVQNLPPMGPPAGGLTIKMAESHHEQIAREHPEWFKQDNKSIITLYPPTITLTEDQANTPDNPICISLSLSPLIAISLQGNESNSSVYCSGAGSQHGFRWEYDNDALEIGVSPVAIRHLPSDPTDPSFSTDKGWVRQQTFYQWGFLPKETGTVRLTFKKYYYSNAKVFNLDGSSPWKDPVETIQFTINVVDSATDDANFYIPASDKWPLIGI